MALQRFSMTAMLFTSALIVLAYPNAKDLRALHRTNPSTLSGIVLQSPNSTNAPPLPPGPIGVIECFPANLDRPYTDVEGCRLTLNYLRTFPDYRKIQYFLEGRYPKLPTKPPYAIHHQESTCALRINSHDPRVMDDFSFEQARALATEILEVCKDRGGRGGFAPIGHGIGWAVTVVGFELPPDPPDGTSLLEEIGKGNGNPLPVVTAKA